MSYRLVESEAGNFLLFRSKQNVLTNHLQGRARNKRADNQTGRRFRVERLCCGLGLQVGGSAELPPHLKALRSKYTKCLSLAGVPEPFWKLKGSAERRTLILN